MKKITLQEAHHSKIIAKDHGLHLPIESAIAFFDLDLTILSVNSASLWVKQEFQEGRLSAWDLCRAVYWLSLYHLGASSLEPALLSAIRSLRGQTEADFKERVVKLYEQSLASKIRTKAKETIEWHRAQGHLCCLMTNASAQLSTLIKEELNLDGVICNHFEVINGKLSGDPAQRLCFGNGKLELAESLLNTSDISLKDCYFYTDSYSDLPLLKAIGHAKVVSPDRRLRREAKRRSWEVLDW